MADTPEPTLAFVASCSDCGQREVRLPLPLPDVGDDFDWLVRDYDGFRLFMMEELAARFTERRRWAPADMEVVIVEALSVVLDQLSDMLDRVHGEAFLETARRPKSVRRLLALIGYDAVSIADSAANIPDPSATPSESTEELRARLQCFIVGLQQYIDEYADVVLQLTATQHAGLLGYLDDPVNASASDLAAVQAFLDKAPEFVERVQVAALHRYWTLYPRAMDIARQAGPRAIHTQRRMVTESDHATRLEEHPLVEHAHAFSRWSGSWSTVHVAVILYASVPLDTALTGAAVGGGEILADLQADVDDFHDELELSEIEWSTSPASRTVLRPYLDAYRMSGQEVLLQDTEVVGINISLSVRLAENYYPSEVRRAVVERLGIGLGGFFEPGNLEFGQDLYASDIIEAVMALAGVEAVCLNRFKRLGKRYADQSDSGRVELSGLEVAVCRNDPTRPVYGILRVATHGGQRG